MKNIENKEIEISTRPIFWNKRICNKLVSDPEMCRKLYMYIENRWVGVSALAEIVFIYTLTWVLI